MNELGENVLSGNVKESFKKFVDLGTDVDHFRNLVSTFLSKVTFLVIKFS